MLGWVEPLRYDARHHVLRWGFEIRFAGDSASTAYYYTYILSRRGVLRISAVGPAAQRAKGQLRQAELRSAVEFVDGQRYRDFAPGVDRQAVYDLAALVTGERPLVAWIARTLITFLGRAIMAFALVVTIVVIVALVTKAVRRRKTAPQQDEPAGRAQ